jgi:TPR repeat protein
MKSLIRLLRNLFIVFLFARLTSAQSVSSDPVLQPNISVSEKAWADSLWHNAEQGSAEAQFEVSQACLAGHVFRQSDQQAVKWSRAAAERGLAQAQSNLGSFYYLGRGVAQDYVQAAQWMRKAADRGDVKGEYNLGLMYALGQGVKKSNPDAVRWYMKAALQGHQVAAYSVGIAYWYGLGIQQDQVTGYMWLLLGQRLGYAAGQKALDALGAKMEPAKVAAARRKADDWIRAHPNVKGVAL